MASQMDQQRPPAQNQQTTQLEFYQAMSDFKTMFPEMDEDVIEAVLRSNNGAVDATIDQLLAMSTDNENEKIRTNTEKIEVNMTPEPPSYSPGTPPPPYRQVMYSTLSSPSNQPHTPPSIKKFTSSTTSSPVQRDLASQVAKESPSHQAENTPLRIIKNWKPPLLGPLPDSFLRISLHHSRRKHRKVVLSSEMLKQKIQENERLRRMESCDDPEMKRYLEDEHFALLLQNEEFVTELRRNKDFMSTLEKDTKGRSMPINASQELEGAHSPALPKSNCPIPDDEVPFDPVFPYTKPLPHDSESDAAFKEKLRNMSKLSRRKFTQLAKMFSRRKKRNAKGIFGDGSAMSQDNLLLDEEDLSEDSTRDSEEENDSTPSFEPLPETEAVDARGTRTSLSSSRSSSTNRHHMV